MTLCLKALGMLAVLAVLSPGPKEKADSRRIKVTLLVIVASETDDRIDPRIKCIADEVHKRNPQLTGFRLSSTLQESLAVDQPFTFSLIGKHTAQVIIKKASCPRQRVELAVTAPCQGQIVYRTVCGKFLPIVTRCRPGNMQRLILAVRVQPCNGK